MRPGAMFTASHNPAGYNGAKFCLAGARPVGEDIGLDRIKAVRRGSLDGRGAAGAHSRHPLQRDVLGDFAAHVRSFVDVDASRR